MISQICNSKSMLQDDCVPVGDFPLLYIKLSLYSIYLGGVCYSTDLIIFLIFKTSVFLLWSFLDFYLVFFTLCFPGFALVHTIASPNPVLFLIFCFCLCSCCSFYPNILLCLLASTCPNTTHCSKKV